MSRSRQGTVSSESARREMVQEQVVARGVRDPAVVAALQSVPRELFLPPGIEDLAYDDRALPIEEGQTISQPYVVAIMTEALRLGAGDRVLEIGTGSGYATAILARIAGEVFTIERHGPLAELAEKRLRELGFANVSIRCGDGTLGWPEHAPYDAIVVTAGGPRVPEALLEQLVIGGRLVIPIGEGRSLQTLVRVTREPTGRFRRESLGDVRFVPLIGAQGWSEVEESEAGPPARPSEVHPPTEHPERVAKLIREVGAPIERIDGADLGSLLERIGEARVVLIGEATHGTSEFYRMRAEITKQLIRTRGFDFVAIEGDWPDVARVNRWVQGLGDGTPPFAAAFMRFPTWMWRNRETLAFVSWLREHNERNRETARPAGFYGLDLYSLFTSIRAVLDHLDRVDPAVARIARQRYSCLTPWQADPQAYGLAAISGRYRVCEPEAVAMLRDLLERRLQYTGEDPERFLDVVQNAVLVADAERYYRSMYYGANESWNLRDEHMFQTLEALLDFRGPGSKAVVWEHNSHVGDARATEMGVRGQLNVGRLCRERFGESAFAIGFGTDHGTVAAAGDWDEPMEIKQIRPSHPESYERLCHESERPAFFLHLREPECEEVRAELVGPRLERAIGVVYRPDTELRSHYFDASLPHQFDELVWFDETHAIRPLSRPESSAFPDEHPFHARSST